MLRYVGYAGTQTWQTCFVSTLVLIIIERVFTNKTSYMGKRILLCLEMYKDELRE